MSQYDDARYYEDAMSGGLDPLGDEPKARGKGPVLRIGDQLIDLRELSSRTVLPNWWDYGIIMDMKDHVRWNMAAMDADFEGRPYLPLTPPNRHADYHRREQ